MSERKSTDASQPGPLVTPKLYHQGWDKMEDFFKRIDECGGWPVKATYVIMKHSVEHQRPCYFTSATFGIHDEWNSAIFSADDYYMWKLSDAAKSKFIKKAKQDLINQLR